MTTYAELHTWITEHSAALSTCETCSPGRYMIPMPAGLLCMLVDGTTAKWVTLLTGETVPDASGVMATQAACDAVLTANGL